MRAATAIPATPATAAAAAARSISSSGAGRQWASPHSARRRTVAIGRLTPPKLNNALPARRSFLGGGGPWWKAERPPNMAEVQSVQHLVDELAAAAAAEQLVVVEFFGTWCSGCRAMHPLMCQLAASRPDVKFLLVDGDENKALARKLGVSGLPTVAVFAGAEGQVDCRQLPASKFDQLTTVLDRWSAPRCSLGGAPPLPGFEKVQPRSKLVAA